MSLFLQLPHTHLSSLVFAVYPDSFLSEFFMVTHNSAPSHLCLVHGWSSKLAQSENRCQPSYIAIGFIFIFLRKDYIPLTRCRVTRMKERFSSLSTRVHFSCPWASSQCPHWSLGIFQHIHLHSRTQCPPITPDSQASAPASHHNCVGQCEDQRPLVNTAF